MAGPRGYQTKRSQTERQISYKISYTCNLKNDVNELIYKMKIDSQTQKIKLPKGRMVGGAGRIN